MPSWWGTLISFPPFRQKSRVNFNILHLTSFSGLQGRGMDLHPRAPQFRLLRQCHIFFGPGLYFKRLLTRWWSGRLHLFAG